MKARKRGLYTESEAKREVKREAADEWERLWRQCAADLTPQIEATILWTIATRFGWGKKRLRKLVDALHDTNELMSNPSPLHHRFSPLELIDIIKDKYDIDLRKELPAEVEVKP